MAPRSPEARKLARDLRKELEAHADAHGVDLAWSVPERAQIDLILDQIDRKTAFLTEYDAADDPTTKVKFSAEIRLLEGSIGRLLKLIDTTPRVNEPPPPLSSADASASRHGRKAAASRWRRAG